MEVRVNARKVFFSQAWGKGIFLAFFCREEKISSLQKKRSAGSAEICFVQKE